MTQEKLGEHSGVHPTEVSRIEAGKRDPRLSTIEKLAKALDLSLSELLR